MFGPADWMLVLTMLRALAPVAEVTVGRVAVVVLLALVLMLGAAAVGVVLSRAAAARDGVSGRG